MAVSRQVIITKIDETLNQLHELYRTAFTHANKELADRSVMDIGGVFERFWQFLLTIPSFASLDEFEQFYIGFRENYHHHIDLFCDELKFPRLFFSDNKAQLLKQFIEMYYVLKKQQFILSQVSGDDTPHSLNHAATVIKLALQLSNREFQTISLENIEKVENDLLAVLSLQVKILSEHSYLKTAVMVEPPARIDQSMVETLGLNRLPSIIQLNESIDGLEQARKKNEEVTYGVHIARLRNAIGIIEQVKNNVNSVVTRSLSMLEEANFHLKDKSLAINKQIELIEQQVRFTHVMKLLMAMVSPQQMNDVAKNAANGCSMQTTLERMTQGYITIDKLTFGRFMTSWNEAGSKTVPLMKEIADLISRWFEPYSELVSLAREIDQASIELTSRQAEMTKQVELIQARLKNYQSIQQQLDQAYDTIKLALQEHVDLPFDSTHTAAFLFKRHWWQGLLGGATGGGGGAGLAMLLLLDPTKLALLITGGAVIGGSLGVGAGVTYDCLFFKPNRNLPADRDVNVSRAPTERDSLLKK